MNIKTITCHDVYNFGASLQAYALQTYLEQQGHQVEIIHYKPDYLSGHYRLWAVSNPVFDKPFIKQLYLLAKLPGRLMSLKRKKVFDEFTAKYLKLTRRYNSYEELKEDAPEADAYIAGSDQIWNTLFHNGRDAAFYLDFGKPEVKRISYAASFATPDIVPEYREFVMKELSIFKSISVRESSAVRLSKDLGYFAIQVVDPVFLLSKNEWDSLLEDDETNLPIISEVEKYILVYDFMNDKNIQNVAERIAKLNGWKIYTIFKSKYSNKSFFYTGPTTFIHLIKNAQCVISNSFHGTAFSLIYQRDFFVVNREDGLNTRMRDLLSHYSISERMIHVDVEDRTLITHINYEKIKLIIENDIEFSRNWLNFNLDL